MRLERLIAETGVTPAINQIEINPRLGGLYVNSAFRDLAGIDPYQLYMGVLLGEKGINAQLEAGAHKVADAGQHYAMLAIYPQHSGLFRGIDGLQFLVERLQLFL